MRKALTIGENILIIGERRGGAEGGLSLSLLIQMPPQPPRQQTSQWREVWRADCFAVEPHQHWFTPTGEVQFPIDPPPYSDHAHIAAYWHQHCVGRLRAIRNTLHKEAGYKKAAEMFPIEPFDDHGNLRLLSDLLCEMLEMSSSKVKTVCN